MTLTDLARAVPDAFAVARAIESDPAHCAFVRQMPSGKLVEPREVWVESLSVWVRADGWSICGDMGRGYRYPGIIGRIRIRRALRALKSRAIATGGEDND